MSRSDPRIGIVTLAVVLLVAGGAIFPSVLFVQAGAANTAGNVDLAVDAPESSVGEGQTTTASVVVEGADTGVSTYDLTVSVQGPANITDIASTATGSDGPLVDVEYTDDRAVAQVQVATLDAEHPPAEKIALLNVTLEGETPGTATVVVDGVDEMTDTNGDELSVDSSRSATIDVVEVLTADVDAPTQRLNSGQTYEFPVTVEGATNGISTYETTLAVDNPVQITDVTLSESGTDGPLTEISYSDDKRKVTVSAVLLDASHSSSESIELGTLHVKPVSSGDATVSVEEMHSVNDVDVTPYAVGELGNTSVSVAIHGGDGGGGGGGGGGTGSGGTETTTTETATIDSTSTESTSTESTSTESTTTQTITTEPQTTESAETAEPTETEPAVTTNTSGPGFSVVAALVALLATVAVARSRS